jgi:hypothetical protein
MSKPAIICARESTGENEMPEMVVCDKWAPEEWKLKEWRHGGLAGERSADAQLTNGGTDMFRVTMRSCMLAGEQSKRSYMLAGEQSVDAQRKNGSVDLLGWR